MTTRNPSYRSLPANPNAAQYRKQAKDLFKAYLQQQELAHVRFNEHLWGNDLDAPVCLSDAQTVLAREHGCPNWPNFLDLIISTKKLNDERNYRKKFAENLCRFAKIKSDAIREAFTNVQREDFLGNAPWKILDCYWLPYQYRFSDKLEHVYLDTQIEAGQYASLNNGVPSTQALYIDALDPQQGERVLHIGCGSGYYTAILGTLIGVNGNLAFHDPNLELLEHARRNLSGFPNAQMVPGDALDWRPGSVDIVFINAGVPGLKSEWLLSLRDGGRLLAPLTVSSQQPGYGYGQSVLITREKNRFRAGFLPSLNFTQGGYHPDFAIRNPLDDGRLKAAYRRRNFRSVRSLRLDLHDKDDSCWLHHDGICLSGQSPSLF